MRRLLAPLLLAVGLGAFAAATGCELVASIDRDKIPVAGGGGSGGSTSSQGGGGGTECSQPVDCVTTVGECQEVTCDAGKCGKQSKAAGTPVGTQTKGDCKVRQCDGNGAVEQATDDTDVPVDSNDCTKDVCTNGKPSNPKKPQGTACGTGGALVCDDSGKCVGCVHPADCATDTECQHPTCTSGVCGVDNVVEGTALASQTAGDCHVEQCDGSGGTESVIVNTDVPVDATVCTDNVCTNGTPSNPPVSATTTCSEGSGHFCNGAGTCVACLQPTDCTGVDDECQHRTCTAGVCGTAFTGSGVAVSSQTAGDCKKNVCNGSGAVVVANDDGDLPNDNNDCTLDTCSGGMKVFTDASAGTSCGVSRTCDASGHCQCGVASDCGTNDECKTFSCTSGSCGVAFTSAGTLVASQIAHDCKKNVCDGSGNIVNQNDDADVPADDSNQCTGEACSNGVGSHPTLPINTACSQNGGSFCSATATCVACNAPAQCGTNTDCRTYTCTANVCGTSFTQAGTPTSAQTPGDCHQSQCDGSGGVTPAIDDTDKPLDDGNQCTGEICTSGVGTHPPVMIDTACNQAGGSFCDSSGACVGCNHNAQCTSMVCTAATHTCAAPLCTDGVKNGAETDVDCGGPTCPPCDSGHSCTANSDCVPGACNMATGKCSATCDAGSIAPGGTCESYCTCMIATCPATFATMTECLNTCAPFPPDDTDLCCRAYHCGAAMTDPVTHCPHASGLAVCN